MYHLTSNISVIYFLVSCLIHFSSTPPAAAAAAMVLPAAGRTQLSSSSSSNQLQQLQRLNVSTDQLNRIIQLALIDTRRWFSDRPHDTQSRSAAGSYSTRLHSYHRQPLAEIQNETFVAMTTLRATQLIRDSMRLDRAGIVLDLPLLNVSRSALADACPLRHSQPLTSANCDSTSLYRTADGTCNNLQHPLWGAAATPFVRLLMPDYADNVQEPRIGSRGQPLPGARRVSSQLLSQYLVGGTGTRGAPAPGRRASLMVMQWGQFLDHDLSHTPMSTESINGDSLRCCDASAQQQQQQHPQCFPIAIDRQDSLHREFGKSCMEFARSVPALRTHCSLGAREQVNQVTSFIDSSNLYGSSRQQSLRLRTMSGGRMKAPHKLPPTSGPPGSCVTPAAFSSRPSCFEAGDSRVNETPDLTSLHTIWLREHNRLASQLQGHCPRWDDEKLFQETRRLIAALNQHVTYSEWLPVVLGVRLMRHYQLTADTISDTSGASGYYDSHIDAGIANVFATAAMRFGHTLVPDSLELFTPWHTRMTGAPLHQHYFRTQLLHSAGKVDEFISGLVNANSSGADNYLVDNIRNRLFEKPGSGFGLDLGALNIQRGRDHGIASYLEWRNLCRLEPKVNSFADLNTYMSSDAVAKMAELYKNVNDIDLYVGALLEPVVEGGLVGDTIGCLLAQQFRVLRLGDRFWHDNPHQPHPLTKKQLLEVRKASLARVVCENSALSTIQENVMLQSSETNPRVRCNKLNSVDVRLWAQEMGCSALSSTSTPAPPIGRWTTSRGNLQPAHWSMKPFSEKAPFPSFFTPAVIKNNSLLSPPLPTQPPPSPLQEGTSTAVTHPFVFNILDSLALSTRKPIENISIVGFNNSLSENSSPFTFPNSDPISHQNEVSSYTRFPPRGPQNPLVNLTVNERPFIPDFYAPPLQNHQDKGQSSGPNINSAHEFSNSHQNLQNFGVYTSKFQNTATNIVSQHPVSFGENFGDIQSPFVFSNGIQPIKDTFTSVHGQQQTTIPFGQYHAINHNQFRPNVSPVPTLHAPLPTVTIQHSLWPQRPGERLVLYINAPTGPIYYTVTPTPIATPTRTVFSCSGGEAFSAPGAYHNQKIVSSSSSTFTRIPSNNGDAGVSSQTSFSVGLGPTEMANIGIENNYEISKVVQVVDSPALYPSGADLTTYRDTLILTNRPHYTYSTVPLSAAARPDGISVVSVYTRFPAPLRPMSSAALFIQSMTQQQPVVVTSLLWGGGAAVTHQVQWPRGTTKRPTDGVGMVTASHPNEWAVDSERPASHWLSDSAVISIRPGHYQQQPPTAHHTAHLVTVTSTHYSIHTLTTLTRPTSQHTAVTSLAHRTVYTTLKTYTSVIDHTVFKSKKPIIIKQIIRTVGNAELKTTKPVNIKPNNYVSAIDKVYVASASTRLTTASKTFAHNSSASFSPNSEYVNVNQLTRTSTGLIHSASPSGPLTSEKLSHVLLKWHTQTLQAPAEPLTFSQSLPESLQSPITVPLSLEKTNSLEENASSRCVAVGFWKRLPNMDNWCTFNCLKKVPPSCPIAHCRCK